MRLAFLLALAAAFAAFSPAQAATRGWPASGFNRIDMRAAADVAVHRGPRFSVVADGDPRVLAHLDVRVQGGLLVIGWQDDRSFSTHDTHTRIDVTMPSLVGVAVSGAGDITVDHAASPVFAAEVGGAGDIRIADLRTRDARLTVGGTGNIRVAGQAQTIAARMSGVGGVDAQALVAHGGTVEVSGTGHVHAHVDGPVDVTVSGVGGVTIDGHARCTVHKSGLGSVRCGG